MKAACALVGEDRTGVVNVHLVPHASTLDTSADGSLRRSTNDPRIDRGHWGTRHGEG